MSWNLNRVAFIGNYLPRRCGIATFTTDLCEAVVKEAPETRCMVLAMNDTAQGYDYPPLVRFQIGQTDLSDYDDAADFLNLTRNDIVCVQHEYGIFGGPAGAYLLSLLREVRIPIVTTLHTVLREPDKDQRRVFAELAELSDRLVVMSKKASEFLHDVYGVPQEKTAFIHHGVPDMPFLDPNFFKDLFNVEGRRVILTFGLLSRDKAIEDAIRAIEKVAKKHPDIVYIVLGATHPHVVRRDGEEYRFFLQNLVKELDLSEHVVFYNRFVDAEELRTFLGAADICITPYTNEAQITSGTLAYYVGTGKAVVSTPYWYAQELLAEGRGSLVAFSNPSTIAATLTDLLDNETERHAMRRRAYALGRQMVWSEVAKRYLELFTAVSQERGHAPRRVGGLPASSDMFVGELPALNFSHLERLTDSTGILQNARYTVTDREQGYSTEDNARALILVIRALRLRPLASEQLKHLAPVYLSFLQQAYSDRTGSFHGTMSFSRQWLDDVGSEDCYGRALWALGITASMGKEAGVVSVASGLFQEAIPSARRLASLRGMAFCVLGASEYLRHFSGDTEARSIQEELAVRLYEQFRNHATDDWPWAEETLTYGNASLPHALLSYGHVADHEEMVMTGLRALEFLVHVQTSPEGHFAPVGTKGGFPRGGSRALFDQLPIEAQAMIDACQQAWEITGSREWLDQMNVCYEWFLGRNDLGASLYDHSSGGCRDRLLMDRPNENQGAEATVAWLLSQLALEKVKSELDIRPPGNE